MAKHHLQLAGLLVAASTATAVAGPGPDQLAAQVLAQMTQAQKLAMVDGQYGLPVGTAFPIPSGAIGSAGFVASPAALGITNLQESDAGTGVADPTAPGFSGPYRGAAGYSTEMPSTLGVAASFNPQIAYQGGAMIGLEAHQEGFNVLLAGAMDLTREPRNGRNFEYTGEDPLLSGTIGGNQIAGVQSQHVMSTMKHFALNAQETGRMVLSADIEENSFRQADLLAFEVALEIGKPAAVMCSYNHVNTVYACQNTFLLQQVLKKDWHFPGWVMSDWGATHTLNAIDRGLDQESAALIDQFISGQNFFSTLGAAITAGTQSQTTLDKAVLRILRSGFATGAWQHPPVITPINAAADAAIAQSAAEQAIVLLQNTGAILPLSKTIGGIAVIGGNANNGVLTGGGSSQVIPLGGPANPIDTGNIAPHPVVWNPSPPLAAITAEAPGATITFNDGTNTQAAVAAAQAATVAIVFVNQPMSEAYDAPSLSLPPAANTGIDQDALVAAVAAANPHTIVVIENGGPVLMPWLSHVAGVVEAWFAGAAGGPAIAHVLFGDVDASGRLPITFPASTSQLPRPVLGGTTDPTHEFYVNYNIEGASVGYKWFHKKGFTPLFPFGYGLSYTSFGYSNLVATGGDHLSLSFTVTNTGTRAGYAVPQAYILPQKSASQDPIRLVGWQKVLLNPGQSSNVSLSVDPRLTANFITQIERWNTITSPLTVAVGSSSADLALTTTATLSHSTLAP